MKIENLRLLFINDDENYVVTEKSYDTDYIKDVLDTVHRKDTIIRNIEKFGITSHIIDYNHQCTRYPIFCIVDIYEYDKYTNANNRPSTIQYYKLLYNTFMRLHREYTLNEIIK